MGARGALNNEREKSSAPLPVWHPYQARKKKIWTFKELVQYFFDLYASTNVENLVTRAAKVI